MIVRAILWDFGGVMTTSPFEAFASFEVACGLPPNFIRDINATNPETNAWARFEANQSSLDEFDREFEAESRAAGHSIPGRVVLGLLGGEVRPRMVEVLKRCKQDYQVTCLTNNMNTGEGPGIWGTQVRAAEVDATMALFDLVIESSKEGLRKPDPRIYTLACSRMQVSPTEVVYLDDLGINLKPARALGMRTIKVTSEAQAVADLEIALGLTF
ncbi:MAG: HAD-IA family hydrolase [Gammaproteobacteria bacterium]|nr:HAD-IA family hydrolase [Gammaproteobacteria bacterium]